MHKPDMEENHSMKEKEKREKATPNNNLYKFITLSPYLVRKETGIPISSPDTHARCMLWLEYPCE